MCDNVIDARHDYWFYSKALWHGVISVDVTMPSQPSVFISLDKHY